MTPARSARLALAILLVPMLAWADEAPCRRDGDNVVCQRDGFDKLVKKLIDEKARADVLDVKLTAVNADLAGLTASLTACESKLPAVPPTPSATRVVVPVVLGAIGAAILTGSMAIDLEASGRVAGAIVGLAAVSVGIVLALP